MKPSSARLGPLWATAAGAALLALVLVVGVDVRIGGYALGGVLVLCAMLRAVVAEDRALALKVRSRWLDVLFYLLCAFAVIAIFWSLKLS